MSFKYTKFNSTLYETHSLVVERIKEYSKVLDVGCATGYIAKKLKLTKNCNVWGIEKNNNAVILAQQYYEKVKVGDIESLKKLPFKKNFFDYILLLDILEHVKNHNYVLNLLKPYLRQNGQIIISTPNIAFISIRLALLFGRFNYHKQGILDESHTHFFTKKSLLDLINKNDLNLIDFDSACGFSQIILIGKYLNKIPKYLQYYITRCLDALLAYQFIAICNFK